MRVGSLIATKDEDRHNATWETLDQGNDIQSMKEKVKTLRERGGDGYRLVYLLTTSGVLKRSSFNRPAKSKAKAKAAPKKGSDS